MIGSAKDPSGRVWIDLVPGSITHTHTDPTKPISAVATRRLLVIDVTVGVVVIRARLVGTRSLLRWSLPLSSSVSSPSHDSYSSMEDYSSTSAIFLNSKSSTFFGLLLSSATQLSTGSYPSVTDYHLLRLLRLPPSPPPPIPPTLTLCSPCTCINSYIFAL